ncbi:MAG: hypothetical protein Kow0013_06460 [Pararhodobacter sp.]
MWSAEQIDALTELVVQRLLVDGVPARRIAPEVAARLSAQTPGLPALCVSMPIMLAASAIEEMLGAGAQAKDIAQDAWRTAALIGAEVLALQSTGSPLPTVADLLAAWGDDAFFAARSDGEQAGRRTQPREGDRPR